MIHRAGLFLVVPAGPWRAKPTRVTPPRSVPWLLLRASVTKCILLLSSRLLSLSLQALLLLRCLWLLLLRSLGLPQCLLRRL